MLDLIANWRLWRYSGFCGFGGASLRCRSCLRVLRSGGIVFFRDFQADKVGADSNYVTDLGTQPNNLALDGRRYLYCCLIGHHRRKERILANKIADLDMPLDEL